MKFDIKKHWPYIIIMILASSTAYLGYMAKEKHDLAIENLNLYTKCTNNELRCPIWYDLGVRYLQSSDGRFATNAANLCFPDESCHLGSVSVEVNEGTGYQLVANCLCPG